MRLIVNLILTFLLSFCGITLAQPQSNIIAIGEWEPYASSKMPNKGILTAIITEAFKRADISIEINFFYWPTVYKHVVDGYALGSFPYYKTAAREKDVYFSDPIVELEEVFFYIQPQLAKFDHFKTLNDLKTLRIGGVNGYHYKEEFNDANLKVIYSPNEATAIKKLFTGTVDLVPLNTAVGLNLIKKLYPNNINDFKIFKKPLKKDHVYLIASKARADSQSVLVSFNAAINSMRKDGTIEKMMKNN